MDFANVDRQLASLAGLGDPDQPSLRSATP
jgi:hypothetical protein